VRLGLPPSYLRGDEDDDATNRQRRWQHLYVLPVLLFEFLALALTRAVLPSMLLHQFGSHVYLVMGFVDFIRGFLAFIACPLFGKVSDVVGRRICLFVTVLGTCAPVSSLALFPWVLEEVVDEADYAVSSSGSTRNSTRAGSAATAGATASSSQRDDAMIQELLSNVTAAFNASSVGSEASVEGASDEAGIWPVVFETSESDAGDDHGNSRTEMVLHPTAITVFVILLALSGIFSSTFTLVFAYISDTVRQQDERVSAYGLALATFGLSFTIGQFPERNVWPTCAA